MSSLKFSIHESGTPFTKDYKMFFTSPIGPISPFHDIFLYHNEPSKVFNMIVEIPRWSNAKMEISKDERFNPIKQDIKKGSLRFVDNIFPHKGYIWNYGAFPQTWEDPNHTDEGTQCKGDNDPVDVCEIGSVVHPRGSLVPVKVLGILGLIDEGETDWKVFAIDIRDPLSEKLNDISDIEVQMPGFLNASRDWFKNYKIPTGKEANKFAYNGEFKNKEFALKIISETHQQWKNLIGGQTPAKDISCDNFSVAGSPFLVNREEVCDFLKNQAPFSVPDLSVLDPTKDKWHFV